MDEVWFSSYASVQIDILAAALIRKRSCPTCVYPGSKRRGPQAGIRPVAVLSLYVSEDDASRGWKPDWAVVDTRRLTSSSERVGRPVDAGRVECVQHVTVVVAILAPCRRDPASPDHRHRHQVRAVVRHFTCQTHRLVVADTAVYITRPHSWHWPCNITVLTAVSPSVRLSVCHMPTTQKRCIFA